MRNVTLNRLLIAPLAVAAALALGACDLVSKTDPELYKMGYLMGKTGIDIGKTAEEAIEQCKATADELEKRSSLSTEERLDYMTGCQDSANGRESQY